MALSRLSSSDTTYNALERMDNLRDFAWIFLGSEENHE
jgi:hypothetical protein